MKRLYNNRCIAYLNLNNFKRLAKVRVDDRTQQQSPRLATAIGLADRLGRQTGAVEGILLKQFSNPVR